MSILNGYKEHNFPNGDVYKGNWVNNVRQGKGKYFFKGGIYDGEWKDNEMNGYGVY